MAYRHELVRDSEALKTLDSGLQHFAPRLLDLVVFQLELNERSISKEGVCEEVNLGHTYKLTICIILFGGINYTLIMCIVMLTYLGHADKFGANVMRHALCHP